MFYRLKASLVVEAIEWTGDNLRDVQAMMAPASPLDHGNARESLGINTFDPSQQYGQRTKLVFINKGGVITKDADGRIGAFATRALFEELYEPEAPDLAAIDAAMETIPPAAPQFDEGIVPGENYHG